MNEADARVALVQAGHQLLAAGLVARTWGDLSVRLDDGAVAITPSGVPFTDLNEATVVPVGLDTGAWTGDLEPSSEHDLHREIYRRRPDVEAIVQTRQVAASICAAARVALPTQFGSVPCAPYALMRTTRRIEGTVGALADGPAVLMANHGVLSVGAMLDEALGRIVGLERASAEYVVVARPHEGSHLPAAADEPWDPSWVEPIGLADGSSGWVSSAPYTLRFSMLRRELPPVLDDLAQLTGRRVRSRDRLPRRRPRAEAVLVSGYGALVAGADPEAVAMVVEKAARAWIAAAGLGGAVALPGWQARLVRASYLRSSRQAGSASRV